MRIVTGQDWLDILVYNSMHSHSQAAVLRAAVLRAAVREGAAARFVRQVADELNMKWNY